MVALLTQFLWQDKGREKKKVSILNPKAAGWLVQPKKLSTKKRKRKNTCVKENWKTCV